MCWKIFFCCSCCCRSEENEESENEQLYLDISKTNSKWDKRATIVITLHDYAGAYCPQGDLEFSAGEYLEVINNEGNWLIVKTQGGQEGRVPSNYVEIAFDTTWYFDDVNSRLEAEILLSHQQNPKNAFLVRRAHYADGYHTHSLSVLRDENVFNHFQIFTRDNKFFMKQGTMKSYLTMNQLVQDCLEKGYIGQPCVRESLPATIDMSEFNKEDLISFDTIELVKKLGEGRAGQVYQGYWNRHIVAIKKIKDPVELVELKQEAAILKKCIHKNIVRMYGISVRDTLMIVQEYINGGSLKDVMLKKTDNLFNYRRLQYIGYQVACGMNYLEKKNIIHCDLAARNILVTFDTDPLIVKIADFGMAKCLAVPIYVSPTDSPRPIRWCAPEVLIHGKLSIKSDVWSYGILLMELFTNCRLPYHNIKSNQEVHQRITKGYRMGFPEGFNVSKSDFNLMQSCWELRPNKRPTFKRLQEHFETEGSSWRIFDDDDAVHVKR